MRDIQSKESAGLAVECDFVVLTDVCYDGVDVGVGVTEDKRVVDVHDDLRSFCWGYAVE